MFLVQHDAGLDYYGRRLATCSSDKTIKIFDIENGKELSKLQTDSKLFIQ